jgi:malate dehydrogenase
VRSVCQPIRKTSPDAIVIVVTNPLDTMTYLAQEETRFARRRVFGMAGELDSSRMAALIAEHLRVPRSEVETMVLGSHGDTMVPLISKTTVSGKGVDGLMPKNELDSIIRRTRDRGAEIVGFLGTGSAFYSPSAAVFSLLKTIIGGKQKTHVVSARLEGQYGLDDICIGVPCRIGSSGIEEVVELELTGDEASQLKASAKSIKSTISLL